MTTRTLLGELELPLAQCIDVEDSHGLVHHAVPALDGDFLQRTGRRAARVAVTGVVAGPEAREGLEELRGQLRAAKPVDFVADVATATRVTRVLVEKLDVRELAGKPDRFEYAFLLREYVPPPPRQTEVPPVIPPRPATDTGVLEVEVVVEGEPDFDMGRVTVTAQGGGAGGPASRTLTERAGNLWTESAAPLGEHTVTATVAEPEMTGAGTATVRAGQTTRVRITLVPAQGVARAFSVSFRFDNAFVEPCMRAALRRAASYGRAHPSQKLIVVGHTDKTGSDAYNQSLSERRARAVFACVCFQETPDAAVAEWTALRQPRTGDPVRTVQDRWGAREYQQMLQQLGDYPGQIDGRHGPVTDEAVRAFRCRKGLPPGTTVDDAVWDALIRDYLADDPPAVPRAQLLPNCAGTKLEWIGCGEQDPVNNTGDAHRPNRRVELLFTTRTTLPAPAPEPDTWTLHPPGRTAADWCLGPGDRAKRCAFSKRTPPPEPPRLLIQPAEPGTVNAAGRILREVERADGTVEQVPAAGESFVLITAAGEYRAGEAGSGLPTPARTDAEGAFSFPGKPRGLYALEIQRGVVARLLDAPGAAALGPTVCKALATDGARLDVLILRDPVLREIRLPVVVHLMTALHPATRAVRTCLDESTATPATHAQRTSRDEAAVRTMLDGANAIWGRARVRFEVRDVVREAFATPGRDACHVTEDERNNVVADAATPNAVNLFFFGSVDVLGEGGVTLRGGLMDGAGTQVRELVAISIADVVLRQVLPPIPPSRHTPSAREAEVILAHELGHWLSLDHETGPDSAPRNRGRLMLPELGEDHRRLLDTEVAQARGSSDAAKECVPLALRVAGATRYGGPHGHRFIAIRDAAAPAVTVSAVLPPHLSASGLAMTGGDPGATPTQRTVSRGTVGRTEVIAKLAAAGGRPQERYAAVQVVNFDVAVEGARRLGGAGGTTFVAVRNATGRVTVRADVTPAPDVVPFDMVAWSAGDETDDPLRRTLSLAAAGTTTVSVTVAGVTKTVTFQVSELALNVTGAQRTGPDQFATAQDDTGDVSVEAVFTPPVPDDVGLVDWTGGQPGPGPRFRLVSKQAIQVTTVTARVGGPAPAPASPATPPALAGPQPGTGQGAEPPAADPVRSATITVFDFTLDVPGATRLDGPTGTRFLALPDASDLAVIATITPPGVLPGVVTWTGAQEIPGLTPPQALVRRSTRRTATVTATIGVDTRSIEIFIVEFRLDVAGATRLTTPGGNDFLALVDTTANVEVNALLDPPVPNPPADLVAWTSSDNTAVAGSGPLQRLVPRTPKRSLTVTGTVAGQAQTVQIFISEFTLAVPGAAEIPPAGSTELIILAAAGQSATVTATVDPSPTPAPANLVVWGGDATTPDGPTARRIPLDTARPAVRVEATVAGVTRSVRVNIVTFTLDVTGGATAVPAGGTTFFAVRQAGADVTVQARITPPPVAALPADFVTWTGSTPDPADPLRSTVDRGTPAVTPVQATSALLGGATRSVTIHVFTAALTVRAPAVPIGPAGSGNFLALPDPAPLTAEVVITPAANPLPAGLVAWTGATPDPANARLATVPRAVAGPPVAITATVAGVPQTATLHVSTFTLAVENATDVPAGGADWWAPQGAGNVLVHARFTPAPPVEVPEGVVSWTGGVEAPGFPLVRRVSRAAAGPPVPVEAQALGATRSVTIHVFTAVLTVRAPAVPIGPAGGGNFLALPDPAPLTAEVVITPAANPLPAGLVAWIGATPDPANARLATVPRAAAGPPVPITATVAGVPQTATLHVSTFALAVDDATALPAGGTDFFAPRGAGNVTVRAVFTPVPPVALPADLVGWTGGDAVPGNPLAHRVSRAAAGPPVPVQAQALGAARAVTIHVIAARLTVQNASELGPAGSGRFGTVVDPALTATVTAVLEPVLNPVPAGLVVWGGDPTTDSGPLVRTVARTPARNVTVTATVLGQPLTAVLEVMVFFAVRAAPSVASTVTPTDAFVQVHPTAPFGVRALLAPAPSLAVPAGFVGWSSGTPAPGDPLGVNFPRANVGIMDVTGTIHGVARSTHITLLALEAVVGGTAASPTVTTVDVGLWDGAFDAAGNVLRGPAEANHFVGADTRRFFLRVRDPSAPGVNVPVEWRTRHHPVVVGGAATDDDAPAVRQVTAVESAAGSHVFLSPGLMLVTQAVDKQQATNSLPAAPAAPGTPGGENGAEHRLRRITVNTTHLLDNEVFATYTPAGAAGPAAGLILPVFQRTPEARRRLPVQVFVLMMPAAPGVPPAPSVPSAQVFADVQAMREIYARIGLAVQTVVAPGTPPASIVTAGGDSLVQIAAPPGVSAQLLAVNLAVPALDQEGILAAATPLIPNTVRVFYAQTLASTNRGESFNDANFSAFRQVGCSFISGNTAGPTVLAHEVGHLLTDFDANVNNGHYSQPAAPAGNRLFARQNLMFIGVTNFIAVNASLRLWNTTDVNTQIGPILGRRFVRPF